MLCAQIEFSMNTAKNAKFTLFMLLDCMHRIRLQMPNRQISY